MVITPGWVFPVPMAPIIVVATTTGHHRLGVDAQVRSNGRQDASDRLMGLDQFRQRCLQATAGVDVL